MWRTQAKPVLPCAAASKASFRVTVYRLPSYLTVYAPVCSAAHEAKGSNGFGAGVGSVKHPVFLGSSIIDILQISCDPE